jgi:hypothetical protein
MQPCVISCHNSVRGVSTQYDSSSLFIIIAVRDAKIADSRVHG